MTTTTLSSLAQTSGESPTADAVACAHSRWFVDTDMYNLSHFDCLGSALLEHNITELMLNVTAKDMFHDGNISSTISANETCRRRWLKEAFQSVDRVTIVGTPINDSSAPSLTECLTRLKHVTVRQSELGQLTKKLVDNLGASKLDELNLSNNDVTHVLPGTFDGDCHRLKAIDLSGNALTVIENETFIDLFSLRILNLSFNAIYRIERAAFITTVLLL
jgi:hypothetical protein